MVDCFPFKYLQNSIPLRIEAIWSMPTAIQFWIEFNQKKQKFYILHIVSKLLFSNEFPANRHGWVFRYLLMALMMVVLRSAFIFPRVYNHLPLKSVTLSRLESFEINLKICTLLSNLWSIFRSFIYLETNFTFLKDLDI